MLCSFKATDHLNLKLSWSSPQCHTVALVWNRHITMNLLGMADQLEHSVLSAYARSELCDERIDDSSKAVKPYHKGRLVNADFRDEEASLNIRLDGSSANGDSDVSLRRSAASSDGSKEEYEDFVDLDSRLESGHSSMPEKQASEIKLGLHDNAAFLDHCD